VFKTLRPEPPEQYPGKSSLGMVQQRILMATAPINSCLVAPPESEDFPVARSTDPKYGAPLETCH